MEADADEAIRLVVRKVAKQHAPHDRANANGDTHTDTEGGDHARGKSRGAVNTPHSEARVPGDVVEGDDAASVTGLLAEALGAAEAKKGGTTRVRARHSAADVLGGLHIDVKPKLVILFGCNRSTTKGLEEARPGGTKGSEAHRQVSAARTRSTALTKRFQDVISAPSARRPEVVSR
jgi:hypothetical protein